jgi:hypothetical protein
MTLGENGMAAFQYTALPARVVFGFGTIAKVADELVSLGRKRAFVLSDPHHATAAAVRLTKALGEFGVELSTEAIMHTPVEVTERVMEKLAACNADCIVREIFPELTRDVIDRMNDGESPRLVRSWRSLSAMCMRLCGRRRSRRTNGDRRSTFLLAPARCARIADRSLSSCRTFWGFQCWSTPSTMLVDRESGLADEQESTRAEVEELRRQRR